MTSIVHTCMFSLGGPDDPQVEIAISVDENGLATVSVVQDTNYPITGALIAFYIEFPGATDYTGAGLIDLTTNNDIGNMSGAEPANGGVWDSGYLIDGTPPPDEQGPVQFQFQLTGDWQNIDWEQVEVGLRMQSVDDSRIEGDDGGSRKLTAFCDETFSISGTKVIDVDGDGNIDTEDTSPMAGITIFIDADDDGVLDAGEQSTTTAADGSWSFSGLTDADNGSVVRELASSEYLTTVGGDGYTIDGDQSGITFANFDKFDISGTKYEDMDGDGVVEAGDTGLGGVTVFIDMNDDGDYDAGTDTATVTAADGTWSFNDLDASVAGKSVYEVLPSGYVQTLGAAGYAITGTSGADQTGLDFANFDKFDISGTKYEDMDGDGVVEVGDTGLGGVTVFIDMNDDGDYDAGTDTATVTAADGTWSFSDLDSSVAGKSVYEVLPTGYVQTLGAAGYAITGTSGADQTRLDFANTELGSISGHKIGDTDGFLATTGDQTYLAGWTIQLYQDTDNNGSFETLVGSTVTNGSGYYEFTGLMPGSYQTQEVLQSGWTQLSGSSPEIIVSGENDTTGNDFVNWQGEPGTAQTPGFWKNWGNIFHQETGQYLTGSYETFFGVNATVTISGGKKVTYDTAVSFADALGAGGGGENAFLRASAAGWANASSDDLNYSYYGNASLLPYVAILSQIDGIDGSVDNGVLSANEMKLMIQDIYNDTSSGIFDKSDFTEVASALDAMNNMTHIDSGQFNA